MSSGLSPGRPIIIATVGTHGDVFPYVALARALRSRGHRVTLATNESYGPLAAECGLEFATLATDAQTRQLLEDPDLWDPRRSAVLGARWGMDTLPRQYEVLTELASDPQTILVATPAVLAARLVQEKLGRRLASAFHMPFMIASSIEPPTLMGGPSLPRWAPRFVGSLYWLGVDLVGWGLIGRPLNRFRATLGLKPVRRVFRWWHSADLALTLFPDWYAPPQSDWPPQMRLTGFPSFDGELNPRLPPEACTFCDAGDPPIAFTFGTGMMHAAELFTAAAEACRRNGRRGILLARHAAQIPAGLPPEVRHFPYVPLGQLLPRCGAVVHHGGIGTTARALSTGTPQVIIPHAWDQLDNAERVVRLGAGMWLKRRRVSADSLAAALQKVLAAPIAARCREVAGWFGDADPMQTAARYIEALV
jgi:UDP:flavonoid glycosyltransferase YjiC (YdhE family)